MLAKERQHLIYATVQKNGAVATAKLVEQFGVSIETIRRDLLEMERQGLLSRVHGGAVAKGSMKAYEDLKTRNEQYSGEKSALSRLAMAYIREGDIISVDAGSTAIQFAEQLRTHFSDLTVVTHSLDVFEILRDHRNFRTILCGGQYLREENAFCGELAQEILEKLYVRKAFIFPAAVSLEFGICDYQAELLQMQKMLAHRAEEVFILADSSKFEKKALLKLSDMKREYTYITDGELPVELQLLYRENDIRVNIPEP